MRRLPHGLVESFKSTLDVATRADQLVHIVDASAADPDGQIQAVREVLAEIGAGAVPELLVFNKADLAPLARPSSSSPTTPGPSRSAPSPARASTTCCASLGDRLRGAHTVVELAVPYERGDVIAAIHREGEVVSTRDEDGRLRVLARLSDASAGRLAEFVVAP